MYVQKTHGTPSLVNHLPSTSFQMLGIGLRLSGSSLSFPIFQREFLPAPLPTVNCLGQGPEPHKKPVPHNHPQESNVPGTPLCWGHRQHFLPPVLIPHFTSPYSPFVATPEPVSLLQDLAVWIVSGEEEEVVGTKSQSVGGGRVTRNFESLFGNSTRFQNWDRHCGYLGYSKAFSRLCRKGLKRLGDTCECLGHQAPRKALKGACSKN